MTTAEQRPVSYRQAGVWQFPDQRPEGWHVVPPDQRTGPDGVVQTWTVVPEGHPDARHALSHVHYEAVSSHARRHAAQGKA